MAVDIRSKAELIADSCIYFRKHFNGAIPTHAGSAPGRVNLIGEHVDYNNGYVLPMALPMYTVVVGKMNKSTNITIHTMAKSMREAKQVTFRIPQEEKLTPGIPKWGNYCKGVVANFKGEVPGFDAVINSSVPIGGGVSSSASLEVAVYTFLEALTGIVSDLEEKALACQQAEHEYAKVPCGIMDQYSAVFSTEGKILLLDCANLETKVIDYTYTELVVLVTDTGVERKIRDCDYAVRRRRCYEAANQMGVSTLREADMDMLKEYKRRMDPITYRRVRHVVSEIQRTLDAVEALLNNDYRTFGYLMLESHNSLRYDYEVSSDELDSLVDIAMKTRGVYGSRMTGAGFGGCTVTLLKAAAIDELIARTKAQYKGNAKFYVATPAGGAADEAQLLATVLAKLTSRP